jgi:hypothetical protein
VTISIPSELEKALVDRAQERQISLEELVREALVWYMQISPATIDELSAWQEVRDEALQLVEEPPV